MKAQKLIPTDTIHTIPVSLLGGLSYLVLGLTGLKVLRLLLFGSIPMAVVGGRLLARLPVKLTWQELATVLLVASLKLLVTYELPSNNSICVERIDALRGGDQGESIKRSFNANFFSIDG